MVLSFLFYVIYSQNVINCGKMFKIFQKDKYIKFLGLIKINLHKLDNIIY